MLDEVGIERPLLVASPRWDGLVDLPATRRAAGRRCRPTATTCRAGADGVARARRRLARSTRPSTPRPRSGLPLVSVPTTYSGRGVDADLRRSAIPAAASSAAAAARSRGIVYDVELTLDLPRGRDGRHRAERARPLRRGAVRQRPHERGRRARARGRAADRGNGCRACVDAPRRPRGAHGLLEGAGARRRGARARRPRARARDGAGARRHATGSPHGAMNALCLAPALRFNAHVVPDAVARFGAAIGGDAVDASRSSPASAASSGSATSACPRTSSPAVAEAAARPRRATARTRGRPRPPRSRSCCAAIW